MKLPREFYIPKGATKISDKKSDAVAYIYESAGVVYALGFHGKAQKPDWHYRFKNAEQRAKRIAEHFETFQRALAYKAERQAKRKATGRGLEVGDVLRSMWGYEQTNIDYYEVTDLIGSTMVEIRPIKQVSRETAYMQGECGPLPGGYCGPAIRKIAKDGSVRLTSYSWAHKVTPKANVGGVKVYGSSHWTSYA